jgi:flagellar hook-associated protein 2
MTSAVSSLLTSLLGGASGSSSSAGASSSNSSSASGSTASTQSSDRTPAYQLSLSKAAQNQSAISLYQNLQSLGQEFSSTVLSLATTQANSNVTSSNGKIASVSQVTNNNYAVTVSQLAAAQTLTSGTFASGASTLGTSGDSLTLQLGEWTGGTFSSSGTTASTISITDNSINGIASAINAAKTGVTASIVSVASGVELQLTGQTTGAFSGFTLSASSDMSNLDYNSTATSLSLTHAAVDASYSVNGSLFTSPTNTAVPLTSGVNIDLSRVGAVTITQANAPTQLVGNAKSLVGYINSLVQGISQVKQSLDPLDQAGITTQYVNELTQIGFQSLNGSNSITTLSDIGINVQPDGTVQFNQTTFTNAYGNDPNAASFVLSEASLAYSNISNQFAGAGGVAQSRVDQLNQLQTSLVYGAQAAAQAAQGSTVASTVSPYGATSNPWAGVNFYQ